MWHSEFLLLIIFLPQHISVCFSVSFIRFKKPVGSIFGFMVDWVKP